MEHDELREREEFFRLRPRAVVLGIRQRWAVAMAIQEVAKHRGWKLHALNVRTHHVYVVVTANRKGKRVLVDFRSYATRKLRESGCVPESCLEVEDSQRPRVWIRGESARPVTTENAFRRAIEYTQDVQGVNTPGTFSRPIDHERDSATPEARP